MRPDKPRSRGQVFHYQIGWGRVFGCPGAVYHVTSRGDRREEIYTSEADRTLFVDLLAQTINRFHWLCHAYCLMDNHYHLIIETPEPNLSRGMRHLNDGGSTLYS